MEVLPKLLPSIITLHASNCTSLREVLGSIKDPFRNMNSYFTNCPKLFKNVNIDSVGSVSKTQCVDSSITSQGFVHQLSAFLRYLGYKTNTCEFFSEHQHTWYYNGFDIIYHGNSSSIPEWFTNKSLAENHVEVKLPSQDSSEEDWGYDNKFMGFGTCVVFKCKKPFNTFIKEWYSIKNFDGASLGRRLFIPEVIKEYLKKEERGIHEESYIIWLHYTNYKWGWEKAKKFITFSFFEELINEDVVEVKECGVRLIYDEDLQQEATDVSMFQGLPTPTQNGGAMHSFGTRGANSWSW